MKGRKPKPVARKRFEGNPGKRPLPIEPDIPRTPETFAELPPAELATSAIASAEWTRLAPMLWRIPGCSPTPIATR